jgi:hypothetical protein
LPNAPATLIYGFADKGEDLALTWVNSKPTLDETYGKPTNEYESYFYNAAYEILNKGGTCIAAKLPYKNEASGMYNFVEFSAGNVTQMSYSLSTIMKWPYGIYETIDDIRDDIRKVADHFNESPVLNRVVDLVNALCSLINTYGEDAW